MPPAFSAEEKTRITELLLDTGYRLFTAQGLRKTSLEELVQPATIAKSSFYVFFDSKEALYLELMLRQVSEVKRRVIDDALLTGTDTADALRRFLRATTAELDTNPLYRRLVTHPEEMEAVSRKVDTARLTGLADNPVTPLMEFVARGRDSGALIAADPEVLVGVLRAVLLVPMHADHLGTDLYPRIQDLLIEIVADGLATRKDS